MAHRWRTGPTVPVTRKLKIKPSGTTAVLRFKRAFPKKKSGRGGGGGSGICILLVWQSPYGEAHLFGSEKGAVQPNRPPSPRSPAAPPDRGMLQSQLHMASREIRPLNKAAEAGTTEPNGGRILLSYSGSGSGRTPSDLHAAKANQDECILSHLLRPQVRHIKRALEAMERLYTTHGD